MEQNVETTRDVNFSRATVSVEGIDDTQERAKSAVGDTSLRVQSGNVEDRGSRSLRSGESERDRRKARHLM